MSQMPTTTKRKQSPHAFAGWPSNTMKIVIAPVSGAPRPTIEEPPASSTVSPSTGSPLQPSTGEFEELLVAHQQPILQFIRSQIPNHHESEDLLQKTNLILVRKRARFEKGTNFRAWSFAIARREVLSQLRRERKALRVFSGQLMSEADTEATPITSEEDVAPLSALRDCLNDLSYQDQELLLMRYGTNRTLGDYAKALNRSPGTLKARLFKIRETLRRNIMERLSEPEPPVVPGSGSASDDKLNVSFRNEQNMGACVRAW